MKVINCARDLALGLGNFHSIGFTATLAVEGTGVIFDHVMGSLVIFVPSAH